MNKSGTAPGSGEDGGASAGQEDWTDIFILRDDLVGAIRAPGIRRKQYPLEMAVREAGAQLIQYCYEDYFSLADLLRLVEDAARGNGLEGGMERILWLWELDPDDPRLVSLKPAGEAKKTRKGRQTGPSELAPGSGEQPSESSIWALDANGKIRPNERNALKAIELMGVELSYDRFRREVRIEGLEGYGPTLDRHAHAELYLAIQREHFFKVNAEDLAKIVGSAARRNSFDPITDYLDGLVWDGTERLDEWLATYAGASDDIYVREVASKFLIAAVRRARRPGCKFDHMPVFEGEEGRGKSSVGKVLAGEDYFTDSIPLSSHDPRHTIEAMRGMWIGELGELAQLKRADVETVKSWLSRTKDVAALKYEPESVGIPRRFVVFGTVNPDGMGYLQSKTGNRRFWPIRVDGFDLQAIQRDRNNLWAEAAHREAQGESLELSTEAKALAFGEQAAREAWDEWDEIIAAHLDSVVPFEQEKYFTTVQDMAANPLHLEAAYITPAVQQRISAALRRYGLVSRVKKVRGRWFWGFPPA